MCEEYHTVVTHLKLKRIQEDATARSALIKLAGSFLEQRINFKLQVKFCHIQILYISFYDFLFNLKLRK